MVLVPQTHLIMWKTSAKPKLKDSLHNSRPGFLKTIRIVKQQGKSEKAAQPRGSKSNVMSWMGINLGQKRDIHRKTGDI